MNKVKARHNGVVFTEGDFVTLKHGCSGAVPEKIYKLVVNKHTGGLTTAVDGYDEYHCSCIQNYIHHRKINTTVTSLIKLLR